MNAFNCLVEYLEELFPKSNVRKINFKKLSKESNIWIEDKFLFRTEDIAHYFLITLKKYLIFLEDFNQKIKGRHKYSDLLQKRLNSASNKMMSVAYLLEKEVSLVSRKAIRELFRKCIGKYSFQSKMIKRFYEKPRGYPGDYLMFEMIYDYRPISEGIGLYFDNYVLTHPLVKAAINRKDKMRKILFAIIRFNWVGKYEVLNVGCGSCRELRELFNNCQFIDTKRINFTLLDQDAEAISFVKKNIRPVSKNINVKFIEKNILEMIGLVRDKRTSPQIKTKDIIYSIGVADYFLENMLERFIYTCYRLLKPKGKLIVAFCSLHNPEYYVSLRWFCEWIFFTRNAKQIENLIRNKVGANFIETIWEKSKQIFFTIITKEK
jgi:SAM-dependent methyltransferase